MPVNIIRPGRKDWHKKFHGVCTYCECEFKCSQDDGEYVVDARGDEIVRLKCPSCLNDCVARLIPVNSLKDIYH